MYQLIVARIYERFQSISDFCRAYDRNKKTYLDREDIKIAFKAMDPLLSDQEFNDVFAILAAKSKDKRKILFYDMQERLRPELLNVVAGVAGRLLNGFDVVQESLAMKVSRIKGDKVS